MAVTTQLLPKQLSKEIDTMHMEEYDKYPAEYTKIAKISDAKKGDGGRITEAEITGLGLFRALSESQSVSFDTPEEGHEKTRRPIKAGLGFQVTEEAIDDERFGKIARMGGTLGRSAQEYMDMAFWDLFNRGFTTHLAASGQYIFDTDHALLKPLRGTTTQSNTGTAADLTETSLAAAIEYMGKVVDERGMPIPSIHPKHLIVTPDERFAADRLHTQQYGGTYAPGGLITSATSASLNAANPKNGLGASLGNTGWMPFTSRWLTDDDAWFLLSDRHDFRIVWKKRAKLTKHEDFNTGNVLVKSVVRFYVFCNQYRYAYGNPGAA